MLAGAGPCQQRRWYSRDNFTLASLTCNTGTISASSNPAAAAARLTVSRGPPFL